MFTEIDSISVSYHLCFVQIGGGETPDETTLVCSRGSDRFGAYIPFEVIFISVLQFFILWYV